MVRVPVKRRSRASLNDPTSKAVVAPGSNGLSSIAWLDLSSEPQVLHVPLVRHHFFVLALEDPYTNDIVNLGSVHGTRPGNYVICGPGQHSVPVPAGTHRVDVGYARIWVIGSTQLKGPGDVANVNKIQDGYTLTPLSEYGTGYHPVAPAHPETTVKNSPLPTGLAFFDVLGKLLAEFPPPAADQAELSALAAVGVGPGEQPSHEPGLSPTTLQAWPPPPRPARNRSGRTPRRCSWPASRRTTATCSGVSAAIGRSLTDA